MHFQQMKQAAKQYLDTVKLSAPIARLQVQLEQAMGKLAEQGWRSPGCVPSSSDLPEPSAAEVVVPMRAQIERELETVRAETSPAPRREPPPEPLPEPVQAPGVDMAKRRTAPPPPRRPGY